MSTDQSSNIQIARVSQPVFLGVQWTFAGVCTLSVLFRLGVRLSINRQILLDDFLVILAWAIFLTTTIIWQVQSPTLYKFYDVQRGIGQWTPDFADRYGYFLRFVAPLNILFYSGLWCIKFSFLSFFYKLGSKIQSHRIWWWVVLIATVGVYIASVADIDYRCSLAGFEWIAANCQTLRHIHYQNRTFYANCAGDVITDLMILSIPILILWPTHISLRKKIILTGIFSVTVAVMIIAIIRVAVNNNPNQNTDISWLYFWSFIEMGTAILVACVASFRQLFVTTQNQHLYGNNIPVRTRGGGWFPLVRSNWSFSWSRSLSGRLVLWGRQASKLTGLGNSSTQKKDHKKKQDGSSLIASCGHESGVAYEYDEIEFVNIRVNTNEQEREREQV